MAHNPLEQLNKDLISKEQVQREITILKQKFINDITFIANQCYEPIEVLIEQRSDNSFFREAQRHPFDLKINTVDCHIGLPFVMGKKSIELSQQ